MDPLTIFVSIFSISAVAGSIVSLVLSYLHLKAGFKSSKSARITIKVERSDGTTIELEIDQSKFGTQEVKNLLGSLRSAAGEPSFSNPSGTGQGANK